MWGHGWGIQEVSRDEGQTYRWREGGREGVREGGVTRRRGQKKGDKREEDDGCIREVSYYAERERERAGEVRG